MGIWGILREGIAWVMYEDKNWVIFEGTELMISRKAVGGG